jgi:bacterioferritin-associated ferredoxin
MIVCHCFGISDREVRRCAREGARDLVEVGRACGAGTGCGGCNPELESLVAKEAPCASASALLVMLRAPSAA